LNCIIRGQTALTNFLTKFLKRLMPLRTIYFKCNKTDIITEKSRIELEGVAFQSIRRIRLSEKS